MARSLFWTQVRALMIKDLMIARNNVKGTIIELVFPLFMGVLAGLFILLFNVIQSGGNEYADNDAIPLMNASVGVKRWLGYHAATAGSLAQQAIQEIVAASAANGTLTTTTLLTTNTTLQAGFVNAFNAFNETADAVYGGIETGTVLPDLVDVVGAGFGDTKAAVKTFMRMGLLINSLHFGPSLLAFAPTVQWLDMVINLRAIFSSSGAQLLIYAFIPAITITAGRLVEDKRVKARETLKVMGCTDTAYLLASALVATLRMAIGVSLIAVVLAAFGAIPPSHIPLVMGIALLFAWSLIAYAQITASVTATPVWANVMCIVLLAGGAVLSGLSTGWPKILQVLMCLLSPVAFFYGILPSMSEGTVHLLVTPGDAAVMLVIDTLLYILVGNYIYAVNPGDFGVPKHPLFFIRWLWVKKAAPKKDGLVQNDEEIDPSKYRVVLQNLVKFYGSAPKPSVDHLSISIKVGEIYALLGHNGAGKTTVMSILTGMITPTSYDVATIGGADVALEMDKIRESVGLCPQFDVLFGDLSARDHLLMFARIKGVADPEAAAQRLLDDLELPLDNQRTETFSGGMKRRLSVGNAIVGGASLLFLDEPSSGMDPLSRRQMWDLLKRLRDSGKTIVLTTHFMEEADYLGDRIAIMSRGRLFCCATSSELKHKYGTGFTLTAAKGERCDVAAIKSLLCKHVPQVKALSDGVGDVSFELPSNQLPKFAAMLTDFEAQQQALGVSSYGVTMSTLEDVFVAISTAEEKKHIAEHEAEAGGHSASAAPSSTQPAAVHRDDGEMDLVGGQHMREICDRAGALSYMQRTRSQTMTVFWRKMTLFRRSRRMQLMIIFFPIFFLLLAFISIQPQSADSGASFAEGKAVDPTNFNFVMIAPRDADANHALADSINQVFLERFGLPINQLFFVEKYGDFASGLYLPVESVSFIKGFNSPEVPTGVIVHENRLSDKTAPRINMTLLWNRQFDPSWSAVVTNLVEAAARRQAFGSDAASIVIGSRNFAIPVVEGGGGDKFTSTKLFNMMQVGMYMALSIGQIVASCAIPTSDEIGRQVYHVNTALGMTSLAFFLGNFMFDLLMCSYPFLLFVLGIFWQQIESFQTSAMLMVILAGILYCGHVVMHGFILVSYLQGMKPYVYTVLIHAINLFTLGAPYMIDVVFSAAHITCRDKLRPFYLSMYPASAWYFVMDETSYKQKSEATASMLWDFSGLGTGWAFVFLVGEYVVTIAIVYSFATSSGLYSRWARYRERTLAAQQAKLDAANAGRHHVGDENHAPSVEATRDDSDVVDERKRVDTGVADHDMTVLKDLRKQYGDAKVALKNLSLGIKRGECFGLLGPNGAGKSTACKLILRQIQPTSGDVRFPDGNVSTETPQDEAFQRARLGVCQQGDTLWEYLSAKEHMDQYLRLRLTSEYRPELWATYIERTIERVQLGEAGDKQAGGYSGGMKRKLQVCLAMYTGGSCIFLDEPSTGMDPFARRALWKVILDACRHDSCVVLTTHSMEEAEAVCNRISIITSGALRCIGTAQHLKNKFGSGYVITVSFDPSKMTPSAVDGLKAACREQFGATFVVKEELGPLHRYGVQTLPSLAEAFRFLNENAAKYGVDEYSVTQTASLEQIFLSFVSTTRDN